MSHPSFYVVTCRYRRQTFIVETDLAEADRDGTVKAVATGEFPGEVVGIYRCAPAAGTIEDATRSVLEQVAQHLNRTGTAPCESVAKLLWENGISCAPELLEDE